MSRVWPGQKFVNTSHLDKSVLKPKRLHVEGEDYRKSTKLSDWLFKKYDMSHKTYRNKSFNRRRQLRREFLEDTLYSFEKYCLRYNKTLDDIADLSPEIQSAWHEEYVGWFDKQVEIYECELQKQNRPAYEINNGDLNDEDCMSILAEISVPFNESGEPVGIWSDD